MKDNRTPEEARRDMYRQLLNTDVGKLVLADLEAWANIGGAVASESDLYKIGVRDGKRHTINRIKQILEN